MGTAEESDALTCKTISKKLQSITGAMKSNMCTGNEVVDEDTCNTVATKAIPLCMVQEDKAGKEACMQMTAKAIAKEEVGPVMKDCRCQAFNKIKDELLSA